MDIKRLIQKKLLKNKEIRVADIVRLTGFSRAYINRFFRELKDKGEIVLIGKANQAKYIIASKKNVEREKNKIMNFHGILHNKNLKEDGVLDQIKKQTGIWNGLSENIGKIINYAFLEMLNNAIEHSHSKKIEVNIVREAKLIRFEVVDFGIGIYNNIRKKKDLADDMEAIGELTKGKQTTAPEEHTGEGIFFTSKMADIFVIQSSKKKLIFNNLIDDIFVEDLSKKLRGTKVIFNISLKSKKNLNNIFREYSGNSFEFSKTKVLVKLYKIGTEYISRSQARRIMYGLDKFKFITLDFRNVKSVGQSFADEVFRIWQNKHPHIIINPTNTNENIDFMIKRAIG